MYKITNISSGEIVCDLATKGKTLRVGVQATQTVQDTEMTPHIFNIEKRGYIVCVHIKDKAEVNTSVKTPNKVSNKVSKNTNKVKED